ncbi:hypothetical protein ACQ4PT_057965 [Festuca glaucescens]
MAEIVSSVVIGEAVNRATSFLLALNDERGAMSEEDLERLEMAHIKMEAALEAARRWNIADASLLRWRGMLKRAAGECEDALLLHRCNRRSMDEQEQQVQNSSFPRRIAHTTKSYISYFASYCIGKDSQQQSQSSIASAVRRFERFADGASEFIRLVALGGSSTPRDYMFFDPLIGHLLAGKELNYEVSRGSGRHFFGIRPICFEERGVEAMLCYDYHDHKALEKNFRLGAMLRLSESTDVVGVMLACLQQLVTTPHFRPTADAAMKQLTQLPTQDFSCKPYFVSNDIEHWNYHKILTEWFRLNPRCCRDGHPGPMQVHPSNTDVSNFFPEPVIEVFLQRNMSMCEIDVRQSTDEDGGAGVHQLPLLKMWALFTPHASSQDLRHAQASTSAIEVINGQKKHGSEHTGISRQQMDELMLPKAIQYLSGNTEATTYQLFWKSTHGTLQLSVEKIGTKVQSRAARRTIRRRAGDRRNAMPLEQQQRQAKLGRWKQRKQVAVDLLKSWAAFAPDQLQGSIKGWIQRVDNRPSNGLR